MARPHAGGVLLAAGVAVVGHELLRVSRAVRVLAIQLELPAGGLAKVAVAEDAAGALVEAAARRRSARHLEGVVDVPAGTRPQV